MWIARFTPPKRVRARCEALRPIASMVKELGRYREAGS